MRLFPWIRRKRSARLLRRASHSVRIRHRLVIDAEKLHNEDVCKFAKKMDRQGEPHLIVVFCDTLNERSYLLEPCLWLQAVRFKGSRLWRDLLWKHADRSKWCEPQWKKFALLCGVSGDLSLDVAEQAGIPVSDRRRWWAPPLMTIQSNGDLEDDSAQQIEPIKPQPPEGEIDQSVYEEYLSEVKLKVSVGLDRMTGEHLETLAVEMMRHGSGTLASYLFTLDTLESRYRIIERSGQISSDTIEKFRNLQEQDFQKWLITRAKIWTDCDNIGEVLGDLSSFEDVVSEESLSTLCLTPPVLKYLNSYSFSVTTGHRKKDIYRIINKVYVRDIISQRFKLIKLVNDEISQTVKNYQETSSLRSSSKYH